MPIVRVLLSLLLVLTSSIAYASNWQFGGGANNYKGQLEYQFYDADTVTFPDNNTVRFWVESITDKNIDRYFKKHEKEIIKQGATKMESGYVPKLMWLNSVRKYYKSNREWEKSVSSAIVNEIVANSNELPVSAKLYWEMDCKGNRIRLIEGNFFNEKGMIISSEEENPAWRFIAPDSNSEYWSLMLCKYPH